VRSTIEEGGRKTGAGRGLREREEDSVADEESVVWLREGDTLRRGGGGEEGMSVRGR
jgi:hypothetical protein